MVNSKSLRLIAAYRDAVRDGVAQQSDAADAAEQQAKIDLMRHIAVMEQALIETRQHLRVEAQLVAEVCEQAGLE